MDLLKTTGNDLQDIARAVANAVQSSGTDVRVSAVSMRFSENGSCFAQVTLKAAKYFPAEAR